MRKAPLVAALLLVLGSALDAAATVTLQCPPSQNAFVGLQTTVQVKATSSVTGATVTIVSTPLPQGATFTLSSATNGPPPSSTYLLQWTPTLGQSSASVSFQASDSAGGTSVGSCTTNLTIGQAQIQYVSGIIRDFKAAHSDFGVADGDAGKQLVMNTLGFDGKPVFDTGSGSTTIAGANSFNEWFNDVPGTNLSRVHSVTLSNANSIDPDIYTFSNLDWHPVDNELFGNEGQAHNNYFTYEVHSYVTIHPFQTLNFTSSDDLWIYIDGKLVPGLAAANMPGVHLSKSIGVDLGALGLPSGGVYRLDIFFAHRSSAHVPMLKLQINKATVCDALSAGQQFVSYGTDMTGMTLRGDASIEGPPGNRLRLITPLPLITGAGWIPAAYSLAHGFKLTFTSQITKTGANADGFAVVFGPFQTYGGGALGYAGLSNSLAIEFDNYQNNADLSYNHISAHVNGSEDEASSIGRSLNDPNLPLNFANGSPHQVRIEYTPGPGGQVSLGWLRVWLNQNLIPTMEAQVADSFWPSISSAGKTFVGFSAGNSTNNGEIPYISNVVLTGVPIDAANSTLVSQPASIIAGTTGSALVQLRDSCNNKILFGGDSAQVSATLTGTATVPTTIADQSDGTYRVSYTPAPTGWGNYNLNVSYSALPIRNSPFLLHVNAPDLDGDGFPEDVDNCPGLANPTQADFDNDSLGDACDPDDDGDGVFDVNDAFPFNPNESVDTDHDGIGNNADLDDDGDGQSDANEISCNSDPLSSASLAADLDGDHIPDCADPDIDGDGVLNANDAFPLNAAESVDTDGDGTGNNADLDDDADGQLDADELACGSNPLLALSMSPDLDGDHIPNCVDTDDDNDGVADVADNCSLVPNANQANNDGDAQGDACDADDDNDGVPDATDAFPLNGAESVDTDGDGTGNNADLDDDGDGQSDLDEIKCGSDPLSLASVAADLDGDHIPNCADDDADGDGVLNANDAFPLDAGETIDTDHDGTGNNADLDDDGDGQSDVNELAAGSNPLDGSSLAPDFDHDHIPDAVDSDDDNDGVADAVDNCSLAANANQANNDGDAQGDVCDADDDNDGVPDASDAFPFNAAESLDTDHDGTGNNADLDDDGDGQLDANELACGSNPLSNTSVSPDLDLDALPDCADPDIDGDGVLNANDTFPLDPAESVDTDHDGTGNNADLDDDGDGVQDSNDACPLVSGNGPDGCAAVTTVTLVGPFAPYSPGASYNPKQAVPLKWQYASNGAVVASPAANPVVRFYGTVACGATAGGAAVAAQTNSGLQYDAATRTWQWNWKPSLASGGYYFTITNQQTGQVSGPFSICLGK